MAKSGIAAVELLVGQGASVVALDQKSVTDARLAALGVEVRGQDAHAVAGADLVVLSPGVPADADVANAARDAGVSVIGDLELAMAGSEETAALGRRRGIAGRCRHAASKHVVHGPRRRYGSRSPVHRHGVHRRQRPRSPAALERPPHRNRDRRRGGGGRRCAARPCTTVIIGLAGIKPAERPHRPRQRRSSSRTSASAKIVGYNTLTGQRARPRMTMAYAAPELWDGDGTGGPSNKSDLYMGVVYRACRCAVLRQQLRRALSRRRGRRTSPALPPDTPPSLRA